jgi:hypothetical protein
MKGTHPEGLFAALLRKKEFFQEPLTTSITFENLTKTSTEKVYEPLRKWACLFPGRRIKKTHATEGVLSLPVYPWMTSTRGSLWSRPH